MPRAGDHDPRLTGGAKIRVDAALLERPRNRESGVLLAERAIGSDSQQALAAALAPTRDRNIPWRRTHVDEAAVIAFRGRRKRGRGREPRVHATDDVEPGHQRFEQRGHPAIQDSAPDIGDADHHRACAACSRLRRCQLRQPDADRIRERQLADALLACPVTKAERRLGVAGLRNVAEKQQVRSR